ncbi:MAG: transglycosylase domain-containing protein [Fimbriimonadales bacterium]
MAAKAATLTTRARKTRPRWVRRVKRICATFFLLFLALFVVVGFKFASEMRHASELIVSLPDKLQKYSTTPSRIMSADGQVLYTVQYEFREPVKYEAIPKNVKNAILAAEDKRFFEHNGVDYWAMGRILLVGAKEGRLSQGGSTLTMQLAKRFYSEGERTFDRKLQDIALAITMERDMTKEQILTLYLNTMYFGEKAYGIRAAADVYFGKPLDKLTIAECAMLARCVRRPSDVNPVRDPERSLANRNVVLGIMRDEKMISEDEYQKGVAEPVHLTARRDRITSHLNKTPYFVAHVLAFLAQDMPDLDLKQGGYTIYTTVDTRLDEFAQKQIRDFVKEYRGDSVSDAAFVVMDKDGKILSEVGGLDFNKDQYNIVTQGLLQPGSSFKAFTYATALSTGALHLGDRLENQDFTYQDTENWPKPWRPHNSGGTKENSGPVSVQYAFGMSLNIPAAHVMERVGPDAVADLAAGAFGFRSKIDRVPSLALGSCMVHPLEMAQGYSVFMLHGSRATPYVVTKIVGPDGAILKAYDPNIVPNALDPRVAEEMDELLKEPIHYTAYRAHLEVIPNVRGKTGTTSDHKDAWFCGYADGIVGVGWVGNNVIRNGRPMQLPMGRSMWGATTAAGIWKAIMIRAHDRFASPVPALQLQPDEDVRGPENDTPEDSVKVIPPGDQNPPDGTTGGDGKPVVVPPGGTGQGPPPGNVGGGGGAAGGEGPPQPTTGTPPPSQNPAGSSPPKHEPPRKRADRESDTVQVEVCAESGMRATIYCPETVTRTFKRGQEPKKRCTIHGG